MVNRKLGGVVDKFSANKRFINPTRLYIFCENSGDLHPAVPGLAAGCQSVRLKLGEVQNFKSLL